MQPTRMHIVKKHSLVLLTFISMVWVHVDLGDVREVAEVFVNGYRTDSNYWMVQPAGLLGPVRLMQTHTFSLLNE